MRLDVQVLGKNVATLFRERDDYVLKYNLNASAADFVSLTMPVRDEAWRWPRDLHPFFRQNLPEGYLLNLIREQFGPLLDGTTASVMLWVLFKSTCQLRQSDRTQTATALKASSVSHNDSARSCSLRLSPSPPRSTTRKSLTSPNAISGWCHTPFA